MSNTNDIEIYESDHEIFDETNHSKLLQAIYEIDGKKSYKKISERTSSSNKITDASTLSSSEKVDVNDLLNTIKKDGKNTTKLKKRLTNVNDKNTALPIPKPKFLQDKTHREIVYKQTSNDISEWQSTVIANRKADQLIFPLNREKLDIIDENTIAQPFTNRTSLEIEVEKMLTGSDFTASKNQSLTAAEEKALSAMNLTEARLKSSELQKLRALKSYSDEKFKRQKRIKSKKFRKYLRKDKQKKEEKTVAFLAENDPEKFKEYIQSNLKDRVLERATLRHKAKHTRFAKKLEKYSKYDKTARENLTTMREKSEALLEKNKKFEVSSDDEEEETEIKTLDIEAPRKKGEKLVLSNNLWFNMLTNNSENKKMLTDDNVNLAAHNIKNTDIKNEKINIHLPQVKKDTETIKSVLFEEKWEDDNISIVSEKNCKTSQMKIKNSTITKNKKRKLNRKIDSITDVKKLKVNNKSKALNKDFEDEELFSDIDKNNSDSEISRKKCINDYNENNLNKSIVTEKPKKDTEIDSSMFLRIDQSLQLLKKMNSDNAENKMTISEAFADDDVVAEFEKEKEEIKEKQSVKDIDLFLPGWGSWAGTGVEPVCNEKRQKFVIKAPKQNRKDKNLKHVIISETKDKTIAKHQISTLPFPYTTVKDFEKSLRAPIGKQWNSQTAYKNLIKPKIVTKMGHIVKPLNKNDKKIITKS